MTTVVSVLISSDFLKMETLVEEALDFLSQHLSDVVKLPIDLECLSAPLLSKIATRLTPEELDRVHQRDKRDKLANKLFSHKLEQFTAQKDNVIKRCVIILWKRVFSPPLRELPVSKSEEIHRFLW